MRLSRRGQGIAILAVVVLAVLLVRHIREGRLAARREAAYAAALNGYSREFTSGMSRQQVRAKLVARGVPFHEVCCEGDQRRWAILIRVGEEPAPWFCSRWRVYVALVFTGQETGEGFDPVETDALVAPEIVRQGEGCL